MLIEKILTGLQAHAGQKIRFLGQPDRSFVDLEALVQTWSAALDRYGVGAGERVAIQADTSLDWVALDLALLARGAVPVVLPEDSPAADPAALLSELDLSLWLLSERLIERLPQRPPGVGTFAELSGGHISRRSPTGDRPAPGAWTILSSSGTAGRAKTLVATEQGTSDLIHAFLQRWALDADDSLLIYMPMSSYQQRKMVYGCAMGGLEMAFCTPPALFQAFQVQKPTIIIGPPALYESLEQLTRPAGAAGPARLRAAFGGRSRLLLSGMAKIKPATLQHYQEHDLGLYEVYGLNESGVIAGNAPGANRIGTVGRPLGGTRVHIAPDGEIVVEKDHPVCSGYLRPLDGGGDTSIEDTRFEGRRVYTGDLGSLDADGYLSILGRKKTTLVLPDGRKVQPEPVEKGLEEDPAVKRAVLFGAERRVALRLVVDTGGATPDEGLERRLRRSAERLLPAGVPLAEVVFSPVAFSPENGMLNRVLKVNRQAVARACLSGAA